jgi:hypothetical protein
MKTFLAMILIAGTAVAQDKPGAAMTSAAARLMSAKAQRKALAAQRRGLLPGRPIWPRYILLERQPQ